MHGQAADPGRVSRAAPEAAVSVSDGRDGGMINWLEFYYFITGAAMLLTLTATSECAFT
jgi:hypothetical protein